MPVLRMKSGIASVAKQSGGSTLHRMFGAQNGTIPCG
jgi:hypothetical protein